MSTTITNIKIAGKMFACCYLVDEAFEDMEAVYAILCVGSGSGWKLIDIGQAAQLSDKTRQEGWKGGCPSGNLWACKYRMSGAAEREQWETYLREYYKTQGK